MMVSVRFWVVDGRLYAVRMGRRLRQNDTKYFRYRYRTSNICIQYLTSARARARYISHVGYIYIGHPIQISEILASFCLKRRLISACWLEADAANFVVNSLSIAIVTVAILKDDSNAQ